MSDDLNSLKDQTLDAMIKMAASELMDEMIAEIEKEIEDKKEGIKFSDEHISAMNAFFDSVKKSENAKRRRKLNIKILLVATMVLVMLVGSAITVTAFRTAKFKATSYTNDFGTSFKFKSEEKDLYIPDEISVKATYIPDGFEIESEYYREGCANLVYFNDDKRVDITKKFINGSISIGVDSENAEVSTVQLDGKEFNIFKKNGEIVAVWDYNGYVYQVRANIPEDIFIKVIRGVY